MQSPLQAPTAATDPKSVKVNLTTGTGVDIEWADGHVSHYDFVYLRNACPCAMCNEERDKARRKPGESPKPAPGALPMFKLATKPVSAEGMGKYAIRFKWNDDHDLGSDRIRRLQHARGRLVRFDRTAKGGNDDG